MVNRREAVRRVIAHQEVRPFPYTLQFTVEAREKFAARVGPGVDLVEHTGTYWVASSTNEGWAEVRPGFYRDPFGVIWNKTIDRTLGVVDEPPLKTFSLAGYSFPDPAASPVYGLIERNRGRYPDRFQAVSIGFALFERAWTLVGMENLMVAFATEPAFVGDLMDRIADYNVGVIRNAARLGVDCAHFGDDWGSQRGPLVSPAMWRQLVKPRYARMVRAAKEAGLHVSQHCCGKVEVLIPDLVELGVDVFNPFQPEVMDIWALREKFRGKIAFWGGLSVQRTLPRGTPDDVRREARRLLGEMAPGGGYILAPSHALPRDVPVENIEAYLEVARGQTA